MIEVDYRSFFVNAIVGLPVCFALWYFARSWAVREWAIRAIVSLSFAMVLAPSLPFSPHGAGSLVAPAVYFLTFATDGVDGLSVALLFGLLPILVACSIFF